MLHSIILVDPDKKVTAKLSANAFSVALLEGKKEISVAQVRELVRWLGQYGFETGHKQGIVHGADHLSEEAANALLKSLEEPVADTTVILTVENAASLLPTIQSRCAVVQVTEVLGEQLAAWGLELLERSVLDPPMQLYAFIDSPPLERWKLSDKWLKGKQNLAAIIEAWQHEVTAITAEQGIEQRAQLAGLLADAQSDLRANVLPRLVLDKLILNIEVLPHLH